MPTVYSATIGVENLVYALLTAESPSPTYGTVASIAPLVNIKIDPKVNSETLYADNKPLEVASALGEISVEVEVQDFPLEVQAAVLGHSINATTGVIDYQSSDTPPYLAIGFKIKKSNGHYRYCWLLKGRFEEFGEEAATLEDKPKFQTPKIKGTFLARTDGIWKYVMDEDSGTAPPSNFLSTVYTPA